MWGKKRTEEPTTPLMPPPYMSGKLFDKLFDGPHHQNYIDVILGQGCVVADDVVMRKLRVHDTKGVEPDGTIVRDIYAVCPNEKACEGLTDFLLNRYQRGRCVQPRSDRYAVRGGVPTPYISCFTEDAEEAYHVYRITYAEHKRRLQRTGLNMMNALVLAPESEDYDSGGHFMDVEGNRERAEFIVDRLVRAKEFCEANIPADKLPLFEAHYKKIDPEECAAYGLKEKDRSGFLP